MVKAVQKQTRHHAAANSFEAVAREWHGKKRPAWAPATAQRMLRSLENNVFPWIGSKPISEIKPTELLTVIQSAERRGTLDLAHRLREMSGQVFRYAVATGRAERDPSGDLRGALPPVRAKHYASVTDPEEIAALLRATDVIRLLRYPVRVTACSAGICAFGPASCVMRNGANSISTPPNGAYPATR